MLITLLHAMLARSSPREDLQRYLVHLQRIQAHFTQYRVGTEQPMSTGQFAIRRPGQFSWEVEEPIKQLILINQHQLWVYDPDLKQAMKRPFYGVTHSKGDALGKMATASPMALFLEDPVVVLRRFSVQATKKIKKNTRGQSCFYLIPKESTDFLMKGITICFDAKGSPRQLRLTTSTQTIHWQFSQIQLNQPIDKDYFKFEPPDGTDII